MTKIWEEDGCLVIDERQEWEACPNAKIIRKWQQRFPDQAQQIKDMICQGWSPMTYCDGKVLGFGRLTSYGREETKIGITPPHKCEPISDWDDDLLLSEEAQISARIVFFMVIFAMGIVLAVSSILTYGTLCVFLRVMGVSMAVGGLIYLIKKLPAPKP